MQLFLEFANQVTMVGLALLWVRAERSDNIALWRIVERLTDTKIRLIDKSIDND